MTTNLLLLTPRQLAASALLFVCVATAGAQGKARPYMLALRTSNGATTLTATSLAEGTGATGYTITASEGGTTLINGQPAGEMDPQSQDDLMSGLDRIGTNAKERNEVNLDKNMMALAHNGRYSDLSSKIDLINIRNYEFANKGQYQKSDLDNLRHKLEGNGWSHLIRNESDSETNDIVVKSTGDGFISDMVILSVEPREVNVVHIRGHFRMEDVNGAMGRVMGLSHGAGASALGPLGALGAGGNYSYSYSSNSSSSSSSSRRATPPRAPVAPHAPTAPATPASPAAPAAPAAPASPRY